MRHALLQLLHSFQRCILCFSVLQQSPHIEHIIQVSLDLHLQFIALGVLQLLLRGQKNMETVKKKHSVDY